MQDLHEALGRLLAQDETRPHPSAVQPVPCQDPGRALSAGLHQGRACAACAPEAQVPRPECSAHAGVHRARTVGDV